MRQNRFDGIATFMNTNERERTGAVFLTNKIQYVFWLKQTVSNYASFLFNPFYVIVKVLTVSEF